MGGQLIEDAPRKNVFMVDPGRLVIIGIDEGDESHPLYDVRVKLPLDPGMVGSIRAVGVREPVTAIVDGDKIYISDGRRRVLHTRAANKELLKLGEPIRLVPVVAEKKSEAVMHLAPLLGEHLNNHRVNDQTITRAEKASRFLARGYSREDVALSLNVDVATVKHYEALLELSAPVRKAVDEGRLSVSAAVKLGGLDAEEQAAKLDELAASGEKITARRVVAIRGGSQAPGKKILKRIVASESEELSEDFVRGIRFALGELQASSIKGLSAVLKDEG
jgi:DNA-binding CsgD family transcriptional regulator